MVVLEVMQRPNQVVFRFAQTDMGNSGAALFGLEEAIVPIAESVAALVETVDRATRAETSGHYVAFDEDDFIW